MPNWGGRSAFDSPVQQFWQNFHERCQKPSKFSREVSKVTSLASNRHGEKSRKKEPSHVAWSVNGLISMFLFHGPGDEQIHQIIVEIRRFSQKWELFAEFIISGNVPYAPIFNPENAKLISRLFACCEDIRVIEELSA
jgi:hypothetical protein